jgi:hypothetical protein
MKSSMILFLLMVYNHADQVSKDIENSLNHLHHNGFIVMHDCNPVSYEAH